MSGWLTTWAVCLLVMAVGSLHLRPVTSQQLSIDTFPDPYLYRVRPDTVGTLVFSMNLYLQDVAVMADVDWYRQLYIDTRRSLNHYNIPEERRVQLFPRSSSTQLSSVTVSIQIGPPVLSSNQTSPELWLEFQAQLFKTNSPLLNQTEYPSLSAVVKSQTYITSFTCENGVRRSSFAFCDRYRDESQEPHQSNTSLHIAIGVVCGVVGFVGLVYCCIRLARLSHPHAQESDANGEMELSPSADLHRNGATRPHQSHRMPASATLSPSPLSPYNYPGSPYRLSDGLPTNLQPLKYGNDDDGGDEEEEECHAIEAVPIPTATLVEETHSLRCDASSPTLGSISAATIIRTGDRESPTIRTVTVHINQ